MRLSTTWPHVVTACKVFLLIGSWFVLLLNQPLKPVSWWAEVSLECNPKQICSTQWVICVHFWFIGSKQGWFPQKSLEGKCIPFDFSLLLYWIQLGRVFGILCCWCYLFVGIIFVPFSYLRWIKSAQTLLIINLNCQRWSIYSVCMRPCSSWNETPLNNRVSMKTSPNIHYEHTSATTFLSLASFLLVPWANN